MAVDVSEILKSYNLSLYSLSRLKGAFCVSTDDGIKLVKEYTKHEGKVVISNLIREVLVDNGYDCVDTYLKTKEGELLLSYEDKRYVVVNWYEGRECDVYNDEEVYTAVKQLALFHKCLRCEEALSRLGNADMMESEDMQEKFVRRFRELKKAMSYVRQKKVKNDFELCFANNGKHFISDAMEAVSYISNRQEILGKINRYFYHGDYNYHNIMFNNGFTAITDISCEKPGLQINDLYNFMRKVLEKRGYDIGLGMNMYKAYDEELRINDAEKELLYVNFLFPEKFWKVINVYYNKKKTILPAKNVEKLDMCIEQRDGRLVFANNLLHS